MKTSLTIPKRTDTKDDLDYNFLRAEGIAHIEKFASDLWTDYNAHDPGITVLEMLCYVLTDLAQRIEMPIENLLASKKDNLANMHEQFLSAINILPSKPVSALDYRKLFVQLKGVKNAWIQPYEQTIFVNCDEHPAQLSYTSFEGVEKTRDPFNLKGLNHIILDLEEEVEDSQAVIDQVIEMYHNNRNFCEDLSKISIVEEHPIAICAYIDLKLQADEEKVLALIHQAVDHYFSPSVQFYSLQQLFEKGYTTDEIFEGPIPFPNSCLDFENTKGGFIDHEELRAADLRKEVRLSDIIQIIMNIEGVNVIKDISIGHCDEQLTLEGSWNLCVKEGHKPVRCDKSTFNFSKGLLPIGINKEKLKAHKAQLLAEEKAKQEAVITEDIPMPMGSFNNPESYTTLQNDLPDTYGVSEIGVPGNPSKNRKAKAKQLKAYLLFFDQILAHYFKHLSKVKDLLSVDEALKKLYVEETLVSEEDTLNYKQAYFSQPVENLSEIEKIVSNISEYDTDVKKIFRKLNDESLKDEQFFENRNQLLDHLIGRFAERFSDYVFIMKTLCGNNETTNDEILSAKTHFLKDYKEISCARGLAFNYCHPKISEEDNGIWDTANVSGVQKRIARLLGIKNYMRRDLASKHLEVYDETDKNEDGMTEYRWRIKTDGKVLLSSSKHYHHLGDAYEELFLAYFLAKNPSNYDFKKTEKGTRTYFNLINPKIEDETNEARIVARRIAYTKSEAESFAARDELIQLVRELSLDEGMFMIEHILLRPDLLNKTDLNIETAIPDATPENFMPSCLEKDCKSCTPVDPYSFRTTIILPGWTHRFGNKDFRNFAEQLIREELPAHVLAKICWVGHPIDLVPDEENDMLNIQNTYKTFLEQINCGNKITSKAKLQKLRKSKRELIEALGKANTIYHSARLHDCENDETEETNRKIILGRTHIGNLK